MKLPSKHCHKTFRKVFKNAFDTPSIHENYAQGLLTPWQFFVPSGTNGPCIVAERYTYLQIGQNEHP